MSRPPSKHPTELELEILKVLWNLGPCSIRQLQDALAPGRELAYTTVMTMLTIMMNKGYVRRRKSGAGYDYEAKVKHGEASGGMLNDLVDRLFGGSVAAVVQQLIETSDLDAKELKMIRQILSRKAQERKP